MKQFSAVLFLAVAGMVLSAAGLRTQQPNSGSSAAAPKDGTCSPTCKVCVSEPKHNTKIVYGCKCEEYCLPSCSLLSLLCGKCACADGPCGEVKVRHRLVLKKVDACDTKNCVLREVPMGPVAPIASASEQLPARTPREPAAPFGSLPGPAR